jgi:catechol 2,3-dioxygenase
VAIRYPTRHDLAVAVRHLLALGIPLQGASDHGVSEAIYLSDPDRNGLELYWDRPRERWPRKADGSVDVFTRPLDLEDLLREAAG